MFFGEDNVELQYTDTHSFDFSVSTIEYLIDDLNHSSEHLGRIELDPSQKLNSKVQKKVIEKLESSLENELNEALFLRSKLDFATKPSTSIESKVRIVKSHKKYNYNFKNCLEKSETKGCVEIVFGNQKDEVLTVKQPEISMKIIDDKGRYIKVF